MKHLDWDNIQKSLEALFVLDDYVTDSSKDYLRLIRKKETDFTIRYSIDNGSGDSLDVIFTKDVILIKGFDHESSFNQFAADQWKQDLIDRIYEGIDDKWLNLLTSKERKGKKRHFVSGMMVPFIKIILRIIMTGPGYWPTSLIRSNDFKNL